MLGLLQDLSEIIEKCLATGEMSTSIIPIMHTAQSNAMRVIHSQTQDSQPEDFWTSSSSRIQTLVTRPFPSGLGLGTRLCVFISGVAQHF